ncbi:hypothetical protein PHJA_000001500 [Phtheirospermum japonicum]|uniref:S-protein homolog n=1 Tax=Phtheirospermum japonicum TaxID=374723 RepID=A0A830AW43_9LAMI|nr:hypothetical protein PHJA_000001500 [Phtheirospermum japonicum]
MMLRCQSGDDDLGDHTLLFNQEFKWSFCDDFFSRTVFFCHLWWGSKQQVFDVFRSEFTKVTKPQHFWLAKSDGIYFSNSNVSSTFIKRYNWI